MPKKTKWAKIKAEKNRHIHHPVHLMDQLKPQAEMKSETVQKIPTSYHFQPDTKKPTSAVAYSTEYSLLRSDMYKTLFLAFLTLCVEFVLYVYYVNIN